MARSLWSGAISFGLLNIPVSLISAKESGSDISFNLLDKRDYSRIGYRQYNKSTGKEVKKTDIVKGFEYEPEHFVVITDKDFERANPKATHTIEIEDFVDLDNVDLMLFETPYYLVPGKFGEKGYVLLKRVMEKTRKVAIGKIVLHNKQRLVAILAHSDFLVCEVLRYAHELKAARDLEEAKKIEGVNVSKRELEVAQALVEGMTSKWDPEKYADTYRDDIMKRIQAKVRAGGAVESEEPQEEFEASTPRVLDLMPLLKKSLASTRKSRAKSTTKKPRRA